jgi:hypothetical protein
VIHKPVEAGFPCSREALSLIAYGRTAVIIAPSPGGRPIEAVSFPSLLIAAVSLVALFYKFPYR